MLLLRTSTKGLGLVEVLIAIFLTATAIMGLFSLQSPAFRAASKADYMGRASEIMQRQLESTEVYLMNQCNTNALATQGIPAVPAVGGGTASATYTVYVSGLGSAATGDASYTITTTITTPAANYHRVSVTVTWPPLNSTGVTQTIYVTRQYYFKNGC